eukprot:TRINITY_DN1908_c0_g2_i1.p1 TRINITY_DN1908_c0_g2~~TRINITY_DN1908_c0_g2_i1.p1  ORF type:complete len:568 (+),score=146.81 TRINITY_DN1908_c0_g2_i1:65-1768(+)
MCIRDSVTSIFLANMLTTFQKPDTDFRKGANIVVGLFLTTAVVQFISSYTQTFLFTVIGDNLAHRIRLKILERIFTLHIGFFDDPKNSAGSLINALSQDPNLVKKITGEVIGAQFQGIFCIICGLSIAFYSSWQIALVTLAVSPLMVISGKMKSKQSAAFGMVNAEQLKNSSAPLVEAVTEARTVAALGFQDHLVKNYDKSLELISAESKKNGLLTGVFLAWSQFALALVIGIVHYVGAIIVTEHGLSFTSMFQCVFGIVFAGMGYGQATMFIGDVGAAQSALDRIFTLIDTPSAIDINEKRPYNKPIKGEIEFRNVSFKYPFRGQQILKNLNMKINAGTNVALVGRSGCGKSTIIQLLMRFYDPDSGEIFIDGVPLKDFDLKHLRTQIGVVFQEPTLFNNTIEYNIKYTIANASMDKVKDAALKAGALTFIETNNFESVGNTNDDGSSDSGFQKTVGPKGLQISGGQKQRIALARCILREPSLFMFDEATSAMDNQTEKSVQETMKPVLAGKTVINVAHRITSIQNSDEIIVLRNGEIVERGPYNLLSSNPQGVFYRLERGLTDDQ